MKLQLTFVAVCLAAVLPIRADVIEIKGDKSIFDGDPATAMTWKGDGKGSGTVPIMFSLSEPTVLKQLVLHSHSGNRYWQISRVRLSARISENADWETVAEREWYLRDEHNEKANGPEQHRLALPMPERQFCHFRLELTRPHPYIYMALNDLDLILPDGTNQNILSTSPGLFTDGGAPLQIRGGRNERDRHSLAFSVAGMGPLDSLTLLSVSPNKYFYTIRVRVWAVTDEEETEKQVADLEWYRRADADPQAPNGPERHELKIPLEKRNYRRFRIELIRPHGWIHMILNSIRLSGPELTTGRISPKWSTVYCDTPVEVNFQFTLPAENSAKNPREILLLAENESGKIIHFGRQSATGNASSFLTFHGTLPEPGLYILRAELVSGERRQSLFTGGPRTIRAVPKTGRFFFPVGTCFADRFTADYGFSVVHNWMHTLPTPPAQDDTRPDHYAQRVENGMVESSCINHVPWQLPGEAAALTMVTADGGKGIHPTFHLPECGLRPDFAERATYWNGHPGFRQYVYNNEICYVGWLMGNNVDFHPRALEAFREFLKKRYRSISELNRAYGSSHPDFSTVEPPRIFRGAGAPWGDWMEFRTYSMAEYAHRCYRHLKKVMPDTVITPKPISANEDYYAASKGIDPWLLRGACDVYGFDLYPWHRDGFYSTPMSVDFHRTQVDVDLHCTETGLSHSWPFTVDRDEATFNCTYWPMFLRGVKACYWFEWYASWEKNQRGYWLALEDGVLTPLGIEAARMAKQVQTLAPVLNFGKARSPRIAIFWPWHDVWQTPNLAVINAVRGAYKLVNQRQYLTDMISFHNLDAGELSRYQVLILPWSRHLPEKSAAAIREFVRNGGVVIADMGAGRFDPAHRESDVLNAMFGIVDRKPTDEQTEFKVGETNFPLPALRTEPSPFSGNAAIAPEARTETVTLLPGCEVLGTFSDGAPALWRRNFGKGSVVYFAGAWFAANRNFFYTQSRPPAPSTRAAEMANCIPQKNLDLMDSLLRKAGVTPELELPDHHFTWMDDGRQFVIFSALESRYGDLYGLTNWGPRPMHKLPVTIRTDRPCRRLVAFDTMRETRTEIPFHQHDGKLSFTLPHLAGTALILAISDEFPLLLDAMFDQKKNVVSVRLENGMKETLSGQLTLRLDGLHTPASRPMLFTLKSGETKCIDIPMEPPSPEEWNDPRGIARKWYVWATYDGTARAFERVRNVPDSPISPTP